MRARSRRELAWFSCLFGALWGLFAWAITFDGTDNTDAAWAGLIASPGIGALMGRASSRLCDLSPMRMIVGSLLSLYVAAALYGLAVGAWSWTPSEAVIPYGGEILIFAVIFPIGMTLSGMVVFLWPLACLNHFLIGDVLAR